MLSERLQFDAVPGGQLVLTSQLRFSPRNSLLTSSASSSNIAVSVSHGCSRPCRSHPIPRAHHSQVLLLLPWRWRWRGCVSPRKLLSRWGGGPCALPSLCSTTAYPLSRKGLNQRSRSHTQTEAGATLLSSDRAAAPLTDTFPEMSALCSRFQFPRLNDATVEIADATVRTYMYGYGVSEWRRRRNRATWG